MYGLRTYNHTCIRIELQTFTFDCFGPEKLPTACEGT